jgi:hypothetical protein
MADDIHAILLIVTIIATPVILILYASPKKTWEKFRSAIVKSYIIFMYFFLTSPIFFGHPPPRGVPSSQSLITFSCIWFIAILVHNKKVLSISIGMLFCMNILLSMHYNSLLESHNFIGKKKYSTLLDRRNRESLENAREELSKAGRSDKYDYREGWLSDVMNIPEQKRRYLRFDSRAYEQHDLWHSRLTGLYLLEECEISLWYPGGMLETSGPQVVYKIKDKKRNNGVEQTPSK